MIRLKDILKERKVLSVFDFDDTLAKADAWIYVQQGGRTIKKLDPAQFAVYEPGPGESFDFRDFDRKLQNPRVIKQNVELLKRQLDKARKSARGARKVTILTARRIGQPVTSFLRSLGINAYVVPVGSSDPKVKADWIERQILKGYDTIYFMDDSPKNTKAVKQMLRRYPNVQSLVKLIKEVDYHSKLSRGHKPDYYQLGTSEFKPFDKSRDEAKLPDEGFSDPDQMREDDNIFSADDEQAWPSGPFGKKDYYPDEAGSSYKRDKDWQPDKPGEDEDTKGTGYTAENFADGEKPGRKGISKRVGIPKGATLTQLAKLAKAKGEKGRMARWQLNMRRGKKKKK